MTFALLALTVHVTQSIAQDANIASMPHSFHAPVNTARKPFRRSSSSSEFRAVTVRTRYVAQVSTLPAEPAPAPTPAPGITAHLDQVLRDSPMTDHHRDLARATLSLLPADCQDKFETFSVLYDNPKNRGLAGRGVVIVAGNVPDGEFVGLLLHEAIGHYQDITCMTGDARSGLSAFRDGEDPIYRNDPSVSFYSISWMDQNTRKPEAHEEDFVSGYAYQSDNFEDLAESMTYFIAQHDAFVARAEKNPVLKAKLDWLETHMTGRGGLIPGSAWNGEIPWDATKLVGNNH